MSAFITTLSHSGGVQSHLLLEMVLRGDIEKPFRFAVINADPGMEDLRTYAFVRESRRRCQVAGIDYITASGPNLWRDIVNSVHSGVSRIDNPPFWTFNGFKPEMTLPQVYAEIARARESLTPNDFNKLRGRLAQKCTSHYKIAPMDRALRHYMAQKHGVQWNTTHLRPGLVEKWIGFAYDEWHRCSESAQKYITLRYPLIERKMEKADCVGYYIRNGIQMPPRSVCGACFSNGLAYFKEMHDQRPNDWEASVDVDNAVEAWHERGITECPVFVSASLIRLRDMPALNFGMEDEDLSEHHCNSGVCFL